MMEQSGHKSIDTYAVTFAMQNYSRITREPDCWSVSDRSASTRHMEARPKWTRG